MHVAEIYDVVHGSESFFAGKMMVGLILFVPGVWVAGNYWVRFGGFSGGSAWYFGFLFAYCAREIRVSLPSRGVFGLCMRIFWL